MPIKMTATLGCHLTLQKLSLKLKCATGNKHFRVTIPTLIPHNGITEDTYQICTKAFRL